MVRLRPGWLALMALLSASALAGCATDRGRKQPPYAADSSGTAAPTPTDQARTNNSVRFASFEQTAAANDSSALQPSGSPLLNQRPAEVVVAPDPEALDGGRRSMPLDLPTALGMTQGQNPRVAFAQAQIAQSLAAHDAARAMWLPSIRAGMNYNKHENRLQDIEGVNRQVSRGAAFGGLGAFAVGAASPAIPGVYAMFHTTDAIFQKQITGYALEAREFQATAVTNDQLLETALAYLSLLEAAQRKAIATETLVHGQELVKLTGDFA